jgi:hypothetical protein
VSRYGECPEFAAKAVRNGWIVQVSGLRVSSRQPSEEGIRGVLHREDERLLGCMPPAPEAIMPTENDSLTLGVVQ